MVLLVELPHGGAGGGDDVVDEEEQHVLRPQVNPLTITSAYNFMTGRYIFK